MFTFERRPLSISGKSSRACAAAALGPEQRGARHRLAHDEHVAHVEGLVKRRVEVPVAVDLDPRGPAEPLQVREALLQVFLATNDADEGLHLVFQIFVEQKRIGPSGRSNGARASRTAASISSASSDRSGSRSRTLPRATLRCDRRRAGPTANCPPADRRHASRRRTPRPRRVRGCVTACVSGSTRTPPIV